MEYESNDHRGAISAALGTGIAGLSLGVLNSGLLGGGLGGLVNGGSSATGLASTAMQLGDHYVTQKEMGYIQQLNDERVKNAIIQSEQDSEIKMSNIYDRIMTRVNQDQRDQAAWNAQQSVNNATMAASIAANASSIAALQNTCSNITKVVVPITSVCPQPMPQYNSWKDPT